MNKEQQKLASDNLNLARREAWRLQRSTGIEYSTLESVAFEDVKRLIDTIPTGHILSQVRA